jgi:excisionase family DNA binding protein
MSRAAEPFPPIEPLVVSPKSACVLLGCRLTHLYELIDADEIESYLDGSSRKITTASIHCYINRKLAGARRLETMGASSA